MKKQMLGWNDFFASGFEGHARPGDIAGRVALEHRHLYILYTETGELSAEVSGRMLHDARGRGDLPAVGDWVVATPRPGGGATIHAVLPRTSRFSRNAAGTRTEEQIVAANIDTAFIVVGLDGNFSLGRIERYLVLAWDGGARPIVVLNKADMCDDPEERIAAVEGVALGVPVVAISATGGNGMEELERHIHPGETIALLGSSGVGKSTLVNRLVGADVQAVGAVSESVGKGKHTTTHRELIPLPGGALLVDTPGMREVQIWGGSEGMADTFGDIDELAEGCRYRDCTHGNEPGCAVREALRDGTLTGERFRRYLKLQREVAYQHRREDQTAARAERDRWKKLTKAYRQRPNRP